MSEVPLYPGTSPPVEYGPFIKRQLASTQFDLEPYVEPNTRKMDVKLPGKGKSNSQGARPVHLIITMI